MRGFFILLIQQLSNFIYSINFESAAKIVLGSGLFAFLVAELLAYIRHANIRKKYIRELAYEYFANELIMNFIIKDFQELKKDPCGYLERHRFITIMDELLIPA